MDLSGSVRHWCQCSKWWDLSSFVPLCKCLLYTCRLKKYSQPKKLRVIRNFEGFKPGRPHLKLKNLALSYVWEDTSVWAHWNHSFDMYHSYLGSVSCIFTFWVSSWLTIGNGCNLMPARRQVFFSFLSFLRVHRLTLEGCSLWWLILSSWSGIWPIFGRHVLIKFCPTVLGGSSQFRRKLLICHYRC